MYVYMSYTCVYINIYTVDALMHIYVYIYIYLAISRVFLKPSHRTLPLVALPNRPSKSTRCDIDGVDFFPMVGPQ